MEEYFGADLFNYVIFPLLIFLARICDVSLGMLRVVLASKGYKKIVPFIGFFEVLIWLAAIGQIMNNLNSWVAYLAWAGGYATGSYLGMVIEEKLAMGLQVIRIITNQPAEKLIEAVRAAHHGLTVIDGQGGRGPVKVMFSTVKRKNVPKVIHLVNQYTPNAFYSVEDVKHVSQVTYLGDNINSRSFAFRRMLPIRKGK